MFGPGHFGRSGAAVADQLVVSGGNFLTIAICAHLLPAVEQGKVGIVLSTYLATVVVNQTTLFQMAAVRAPGEGDSRGLLAGLADFQVLLALAGTAALLGALVAAGGRIGLAPGGPETAAVGAFLLVQQLADFDRRVAYILATPLRALVSSLAVFPARAALLLLVRPQTMREALVLVTATALAPAAVTLARTWRGRAPAAERWAFIRDHATRSRWLMAGAPLAWAWSQVPVYLLGSMQGLAAVGAYVSVRSVANVANVGLEMMEIRYAPRLAHVAHQGAPRTYRRMVVTLLAVGGGFWLAGLGAILTAGPWILATLVGPQYVQYANVLTWLWLAALLTFVCKLDGIDARNRGVTQAIPVGYLSGICFAVAGCLALLPSFGVAGAAMARNAAAVGLLAGQRAMRMGVARPGRPTR